MPRYYLHVVDGELTYRDPEGTEAADLEAAERHATTAVCELAAEALKKGKSGYQITVAVEDEHGEKLLSVSISCVISSTCLCEHPK